MKKIISVAVSILLAVLCVFQVSAADSSVSTPNIDELLAPYQEVIDKVNNELGSSYYILSDCKESVYNDYKDMSLDEFEETITREYLDFINGTTTDHTANSENVEITLSDGSGASVMAAEEEIRQTAAIKYNSYLILYSVVRGSGNPLVYKYKKINNVATGWSSNYTGFHFEISSYSYTFSTDKKYCTVNIQGFPKKSNGLALTTTLTDTATFSAN